MILKETPPSEVLAIILFGSAARGDSDAGSDLDIFLLVDGVSFDQMIRLKHWCAGVLAQRPESISVYSSKTALRMAESGSLLLWHLKLEGRLLFQRHNAMDDVLRRLACFSAYRAELQSFEELAEDVARAWIDDRGPTELDLHILQLVIRNVCILVTVCAGEPTFGRMSAVEAAKRLVPALPVDLGMYYRLCAWHLLFLRGHKTNSLDLDMRCSRDYLAMTRSVLSFVYTLTC